MNFIGNLVRMVHNYAILLLILFTSLYTIARNSQLYFCEKQLCILEKEKLLMYIAD